MKPLSPNTLLQNRYLIVQLIGKGGMGEVYLAVDQRLGSAIALKRTFFSDDEQLGSAFEREARTLARLRHPVLPKVSDHFTENDTQYLVMEHISGDDLSKRLETTRKPFPLSWVLFWADQLLDALAYLHTHEPPIVHRDIKPQNLKLTNENHIILLDFGLAKNTTGQAHTTGGSIVGYTPHYAPMEQIRGTGTTGKSDIYSLAATLYQLMTAQVPPDALTRADYILNSLPDPVQPIGELNPEVPKAISDVILKAMNLSADQRYASAREMQKALRDAYSQMQNKMSEQTVAFNVPPQNQQTAPPVMPQVPPSQLRTEQLNSAPTGGHSHAPIENLPVSSQPRSFEKTEVLETPPTPPVDFDMTLRDDSLSPASLPQSQQKTEVLPADISSQIPKKEESFNPEATVPLISFDPSVFGNSDPVGATQAAPNYNSNPSAAPANTIQPNYGSPYDTAAGSAGQTQSGSAFNSQPQPPQFYADTAPKKSGKGLAIAGIIGGLGVVTVAAGIGLYAFSDQLGLTGTNPSPTPTAPPTVTVTPTPAPTVEQANTNPVNSSREVVTTNTDTTNTETTNSRTTTEQTPVRTTPATPRPTQVTVAPPVKTPPRQTKTPPKQIVIKPATPRPGGRTDILQ